MCATGRENESYVLYAHKAVGFGFKMGREFIPIEAETLHLLCCDFISTDFFALFCTIYSRYVLIYVNSGA